MTPDEFAFLQYNLAHPRAPWVMPPTLPGAWTERDGAEASDLLASIGDALPSDGVPVTRALHLDRVRTRHLACHGGTMVVEAQGYGPAPGLACFILHDAGVIWLDGKSAPIHALNGEVGPALETDKARSDYVLLFMNWVHGDGGRFQPLVGDAAFSYRMEDEGEEAVEQLETYRIADIAFSDVTEEGKTPSWRFTLPLLFGNALFETEMRLNLNGTMEMEEDEVMISDLPLRPERVQGGLLRLVPDRKEGKDA